MQLNSLIIEGPLFTPRSLDSRCTLFPFPRGTIQKCCPRFQVCLEDGWQSLRKSLLEEIRSWMQKRCTPTLVRLRYTHTFVRSHTPITPEDFYYFDIYLSFHIWCWSTYSPLLQLYLKTLKSEAWLRPWGDNRCTTRVLSVRRTSVPSPSVLGGHNNPSLVCFLQLP